MFEHCLKNNIQKAGHVEPKEEPKDSPHIGKDINQRLKIRREIGWDEYGVTMWAAVPTRTWKFAIFPKGQLFAWKSWRLQFTCRRQDPFYICKSVFSINSDSSYVYLSIVDCPLFNNVRPPPDDSLRTFWFLLFHGLGLDSVILPDTSHLTHALFSKTMHIYTCIVLKQHKKKHIYSRVLNAQKCKLLKSYISGFIFQMSGDIKVTLWAGLQ